MLRNLFRAWFLLNTKTYQLIKGDFAPTNLTEDVKSNYAQHTALGMQKTILQFLHGEAERVSAQVRLFNWMSLDYNVEETLATLKMWTKGDMGEPPPVLSFWVGDAYVELADCVLESLSGITYQPPSFFGGVRDVTLTMNLIKYQPYSIEDTGSFETRYHRAKSSDYYETLCQREYGNPMMGDIIRHRHPTKPNVQVGDVVKLPSVEAIRKEIIEPKSIPLYKSYSRKETPTRTLRLDMFEKRNRPYVSHVLVED